MRTVFNLHTHPHTYMHTHALTLTCTHTHTHAYTHTCTLMHSHSHAHTHTHTRTYTIHIPLFLDTHNQTCAGPAHWVICSFCNCVICILGYTPVNEYPYSHIYSTFCFKPCYLPIWPMKVRDLECTGLLT